MDSYDRRIVWVIGLFVAFLVVVVLSTAAVEVSKNLRPVAGTVK